ncbi:hypothetical protein [Aquimarina algiphila]|uniref:hypothetical protein n=1 Tax=Aquimarina algiphila TaxID=2047982 RepID=UPI00232B69F5|nr:hypothetical protein [Aquimarina algiphila]
MNIMYTIKIEKVGTTWIGMLEQVVNYNMPSRGSRTREIEVVAFSHTELLQLMFEQGFFEKMEQNK